MSGKLCVLPAPLFDVSERSFERPGAGPSVGFTPLAQSLLWLAAGDRVRRATGEAEEMLFVLEGDGRLSCAGAEQPLEPEAGACFSAGSEYQLRAGAGGLRLVCVRVPDPVKGRRREPGVAVRRLRDQSAEAATTDREFRIVADPANGLASATTFVGYIPSKRAPEHFHTYDEVVYVLEGEGRFHAQGAAEPVGPGSCISLPARVVHCLENTGRGFMRVLGVFRPAGSPAAAYYPDGTPAYPGLAPVAPS